MECKAHNGIGIATTCLSCTLAHTPCNHPLAALYCDHCASVYSIVRDCVDTKNPLDFTDYEVWATDSTLGAPAAALRPIAGWWADWTLQDGTPWPAVQPHELAA